MGAPREMGLERAQGPMHWEHQVPHSAPRPMCGLGASHCSQALGSLAAPRCAEHHGDGAATPNSAPPAQRYAWEAVDRDAHGRAHLCFAIKTHVF